METVKRRRWPVVVGGIVAVLVIAIVVVLQILDAQLLKRVREELAVRSQQLGRPIELRDLSTRIFTGGGVRLEGLSVGAAPGEELPLATIDRVEVRAKLWPIVRSRGKDLQVDVVEIHAPAFNVVRLADGTTNLEHLQEKLAETPGEKPAEPEGETDFSAVRLSLFSLTDGKVKFVDRSAETAREVAINDLDVTIKDLHAGSPLVVDVAAAVLAEKQNFALSMTSTPLPKSLTPTPQTVTLQVQPIDLAPLAPFFPRAAGFIGGAFDADLTAKLGRAVPGGEGPTEVKGVLHALGLKFVGAEGGKALDVTVQTDLSADVVAGSLDLRRLEVDAGPARLTGKGRIANLASENPSVEQLEIVGQNLDPALLAQYYPPLKESLGGQVAGPIGLAITGSGSAAAAAIAFDLDLAKARVTVPEELTKAAGAPMRVSGTLRGSTRGVYGFDAKLDLAGVDLRPGEIVNKAAGERLEVVAAGTLQPAASPKEATRIKVSSLKVDLLDMTLAGSASAALQGDATVFELALKSPRVDADRLLLTDEQIAANKPSGAPGTPAAPEVKDPDRFDGLRGSMEFEIDALRLEKMDLSQVVVKMKMVDDAITLDQLRANAYGGSITGDGTKIALGPAKRPFEANLSVKGFQLGDFLARNDPKKKALTGTFNGDVALKGVGYEVENLNESLAGLIRGSLANGAFLGLDVVESVSGPLAKALPGAARALKGDGLTQLGDELPFGLTIENGVAKLKKPIQIDRPQAALTFDGGIQLTGDLNLAGTIALSPDTISWMTAGKAKLKEPLPIPVTITGPAWKPKLGGLDLKPAVTVIAKQAAAGAAERLIGDRLGEKGKVVGDVISGGTDALEKEAAQKRAEAEQRAAEEKAKAEARAREEAAKAKQRAEEEAKRRLRGIFGG